MSTKEENSVPYSFTCADAMKMRFKTVVTIFCFNSERFLNVCIAE